MLVVAEPKLASSVWIRVLAAVTLARTAVILMVPRLASIVLIFVLAAVTLAFIVVTLVCSCPVVISILEILVVAEPKLASRVAIRALAAVILALTGVRPMLAVTLAETLAVILDSIAEILIFPAMAASV